MLKRKKLFILGVVLMFVSLSLGAAVPAEASCLPFPAADTVRTKDTTYWTCVTNIRMTTSQYAYVNWSAGGDNSVAGAVYIDQKYKYEKEKFSFSFITDFGLGYMYLRGNQAPVRKSDDKLNFTAQANSKFSNVFAYSLVLDFKSQFANGYTYPNDSVRISSFFAPSYTTVSAGVTYSPFNEFSLFVSPLSGKFTMVLDEFLADNGSFGVTPAKFDDEGNMIAHGKKFRSELGLNFVFRYAQNFTDAVSLASKLELHNSYFDERIDNRWNFDIDFEAKLVFKITRHISSNLFCRVLYDDDVRFPVYEDVDGEEIQIGTAPKFQVNENMGIGLIFKF